MRLGIHVPFLAGIRPWAHHNFESRPATLPPNCAVATARCKLEVGKDLEYPSSMDTQVCLAKASNTARVRESW